MLLREPTDPENTEKDERAVLREDYPSLTSDRRKADMSTSTKRYRHQGGYNFTLIEPDVVLPTQQIGAAAMSGERKLVYAVIEDAVDTYRKNRGLKTWRAQVLYLETRDWFASESREVFTFLWCCDFVGLDPEAVRKTLDTIPPPRAANEVRTFLRNRPGRAFLPRQIRQALGVQETRDGRGRVSSALQVLVRHGEAVRLVTGEYIATESREVACG